MAEPSVQTFAVPHGDAVGAARRGGRDLAAALGFEEQSCDQLALVVAELATNLIRHAGGGRLVLTPLREGGRVGLQVEAIDEGPGIVDVDRAIGDGFSTAGSLGVGLGAVNRLMDDLDIDSLPGRGTRVVCRRWVRHQADATRPCPLEVGVATRPRLAGDLNGDAFAVKRWDGSTLVAVIDGLGHGPFAHRAALAARQYVDAHFDQPLEQIFRGTARACRATRGVVMTLARFDWGRGRVTLASVGNVEIRIHPNAAAFRFVVRRGIIGSSAPNPVVTEHPWTADNLMVLHTDGLATRWGFKEFPRLAAQPAATGARELLRALGKDDDDATVVVVRSTAA